jgi:hypothetical protein
MRCEAKSERLDHAKRMAMKRELVFEDSFGEVMTVLIDFT